MERQQEEVTDTGLVPGPAPGPGLGLGVRRAAEMAAVFMIGDGLLGMLQPRRHVDLWRSDVAAVDALVKPFGGRPARRRLYGLVQVATGILLASRLKP